MRIKTLLAVLAVAAATLLATAVALASRDATKASATVVVSTRSVSGPGQILVNSHGQTLYMFVPDKRAKVTCVSTCAKIWPPLKLPAGAKAIATGGAKAKLLGSDRDPAGGRVVTYNGWPLYTYLGDRKPGVDTGQALNLNGGLWYVLAPSGALIKKKTHSSGSTTTTSSSSSTINTSSTTTTTSSSTSTGCNDADGDGDESAGGPDDGDGCI